MKTISLIIFLLILILTPLSALLFVSQSHFKLDSKSRSINYVFDTKDLTFKINKESKTLTLNKGTSFVKIELDFDSLNEFLTWSEIGGGAYLPPSSCKQIEINLAQESFKKGKNIKFSNITCVV